MRLTWDLLMKMQKDTFANFFAMHKSFHQKFPHDHPTANDLVEEMLMFDPRQRITGYLPVLPNVYLLAIQDSKEVKLHWHTPTFHDISDEPGCLMPFSFNLEQHALSEEQMKELVSSYTKNSSREFSSSLCCPCHPINQHPY